MPRRTMTNNERYELLAAVFCQVEDDCDETVRLFMSDTAQHAGTDYAIDYFHDAYIQLWGMSPPRRVAITYNGEIKGVSILKPEPMDRPSSIYISEENWDIPAIDQALVRMAIEKARSILEAVQTYGGKTEEVTRLLSTAGNVGYSNDLERLIKGFCSYVADNSGDR